MVLLARFRPLLPNPRVVDDVVEVLNDQAVSTKYLRTARSLGKGQYAEVFFGYDCSDGKKIAIKRIDWRKQVELNGPRIEDVLRREIQTMQNINHRNIVRLHDTLVNQDLLSITLHNFCSFSRTNNLFFLFDSLFPLFFPSCFWEIILMHVFAIDQSTDPLYFFFQIFFLSC